MDLSVPYKDYAISIHALREEGDCAWPQSWTKTSSFLSTPSVRRATCRLRYRGSLEDISIHALREESDCRSCAKAHGADGISIHALREEGDGMGTVGLTTPLPFLSTPSVRRATLLPESAFGRQHISIHALREEGDEQRTPGTIRASGFLSTPSARRATARGRAGNHQGKISIHALREEGDQRKKRYLADPCYFYPRPPRGGRR